VRTGDSLANADGYAYPDSNTNCRNNSYAYCYSDSYAYTDSYANGNADSHCQRHVYSGVEAYSITETSSDTGAATIVSLETVL
jgi:hypothetical protein